MERYKIFETACKTPPRHRTMARSILVALVALSSGACSTAPFDFTIHDPSVRPRVSVIHRPLHPRIGEPMRIIARPEGLEGGSVTVSLASSGGSRTKVCGPADLVDGECVMAMPGREVREGGGFYSAKINQGGREWFSPGTYAFQIGTPEPPAPGEARVIPLRVPLEQTDRYHAVLLVADIESFDVGFEGRVAFTLFGDAIEPLLYDGLLEDPVYRWRDNQIGIYATERAGQVSDYYSGHSSRCGADPWPGLAEQGNDLSEEIDIADVIGVLHTRGFRDCAGLGTTGGVVPHFSADVGDPLLFQHELGHALFGLADEYLEATDSRQAPGNPGRSCCCQGGNNGGDDGGEVGPGDPGGPVDLCVDEILCTGRPWPADCFGAAPACPRIESSCAEPNVFPSRAACESAAAAIASHPGIEIDASAEDCRLLCAPGASECPCDPEQTVWTLDGRTPSRPGEADDDIMGSRDVSSPRELHGPACALCIETELCLLWERGSGRSEEEARSHCIRP